MAVTDIGQEPPVSQSTSIFPGQEPPGAKPLETHHSDISHAPKRVKPRAKKCDDG